MTDEKRCPCSMDHAGICAYGRNYLPETETEDGCFNIHGMTDAEILSLGDSFDDTRIEAVLDQLVYYRHLIREARPRRTRSGD